MTAETVMNPNPVGNVLNGATVIPICGRRRNTEKYKLKPNYHLAWFRGYVCAVFQYNCKTFRYSLARVPKDAFLSKSETLKATPEFPYVEETTKTIMNKVNLLRQAMDIIIPCLGKDETIKRKDVDNKIVELMFANQPSDKSESLSCITDSIIEDYRKWLYEGKGQKKNGPTRKDYISTFRLLQDYEYDLGHIIQYSDINNDFVKDLVEYCYRKRENTDEHEYLTVGGLSNRTINKRLDCLYKFIRDTYGVLPEELTERCHLEVSPKDVIRLDASDIKQLMDLTIDDSSLAYARDALVFLCLTGLRYGDFAKIDRTYIKDNAIVLNTNKTKKGCRIHLFEYAKEIGEKYNYRFDPPCNQVLNKQIKRLLLHYDLFPELVTSSFMAKERVVVEKPRREYITCHTGRRSYISMLAETGMNLTDIMSATGHTSVRMLQVYIDLFGKKRIDKFSAAEKELFGL